MMLLSFSWCKLVVFWVVTPADTGKVVFAVAPKLPVNFFQVCKSS